MIAGSLDQLGTRKWARLDERACRAARVGLERRQVARVRRGAREHLVRVKEVRVKGWS